MIRIVQIALYLAIMTALGWALWQVMPGAVDWLHERFGLYGSSALIFGLIPLGWGLAYYLNRRDSGRA